MFIVYVDGSIFASQRITEIDQGIKETRKVDIKDQGTLEDYISVDVQETEGRSLKN